MALLTPRYSQIGEYSQQHGEHKSQQHGEHSQQQHGESSAIDEFFSFSSSSLTSLQSRELVGRGLFC